MTGRFGLLHLDVPDQDLQGVTDGWVLRYCCFRLTYPGNRWCGVAPKIQYSSQI